MSTGAQRLWDLLWQRAAGLPERPAGSLSRVEEIKSLLPRVAETAEGRLELLGIIRDGYLTTRPEQRVNPRLETREIIELLIANLSDQISVLRRGSDRLAEIRSNIGIHQAASLGVALGFFAFMISNGSGTIIATLEAQPEAAFMGLMFFIMSSLMLRVRLRIFNKGADLDARRRACRYLQEALYPLLTEFG